LLDQVPIRLRLTLAFTLVMAVVLAATGLFLYARLRSDLDRTINQGLRSRAAVVSALVQQSDTGLQEAKQAGLNGGFAQVLDTRGNVIDGTPGLVRAPLVPPTRLGFSARSLGGEHVRVLAVRVNAQDKKLVVVVGASLEPRSGALADLRQDLFVGGPIALLLASLAGYLLAAAALRPVERMSERAVTISAASLGRRLPVPRAHDEISRLGLRLNEMLARLESALERERGLVANASHELRTPLALMKTEIELALAEPESAPELAAALRSAAEETDRLSQLTDDLLLLARIDSGALPLRRADVSVRELLEGIATRFARRAADADREIAVVADEHLFVLADRRRLEQALSNLVENALRHGTGTVRLEGSEGDGFLTLRIGDAGPGLPPAFIPRAFDRFSRSDGALGAGTGLGLAIVAAIAQAHGGTAEASNSPGGGAEIVLALPIHQYSARRVRPTQPATAPPPDPTRRRTSARR
jgi:signal transduction histidine kinase